MGCMIRSKVIQPVIFASSFNKTKCYHFPLSHVLAFHNDFPLWKVGEFTNIFRDVEKMYIMRRGSILRWRK